MKNYFITSRNNRSNPKLLILVLLPFLFLFNCQKQEISDSAEIYQEKKVKRISFDDFKNEIIENHNFAVLSKHFDRNVVKDKSSKTLKTSENLILTNHVTRIKTPSGHSYTFQVKTEKVGVKFYNLVIDVNNNGNMTKSHILEYLPSLEWLMDNKQPFSGEVRIINNDIFTQDDILSSKGKGISTARGGSCWRVETEWECHAGNNHEPGTCTAGGSKLIINVMSVSCGSGGGGGGGGSYYVSAPTHAGYTPTNGVGSGSDGSSGGDGTITTMPDPLNQDGTATDGVAHTDNIVFDSSIRTYPSQMAVISEAIGICSPLTQLVLDVFEANDGVNLIIKSSSTSVTNGATSAISNYNPITHTCDITITFSESYIETATDLSIARTTIHESLHAVLVYMAEDGLLQSADGSAMDGFGDLTDAYMNHLSGKPANFGKAHHELMADFIEDMGVSLMAYGKAQGYRIPRSYYNGLCWSGDLKNTPTFDNLYPKYLDSADEFDNPANVNPDWLKIKYSLIAEQDNTTLSYSHPNGTVYEFVPKGTPPN